MAIQHCCGFEHQVISAVGGGGATSALVDRKLFDSVNNGVLDTSGTLFTYQPVAMKCDTSTAHNVAWTISDNTFAVGFWFRRSAGAVGAAHRILQISPTTHELRLQTSGQMAIGPSGANFVNVFAPAADTEYWVTVIFDTSANPHSMTVRVYDVTGAKVAGDTNTTQATAAVTQTTVNFGSTANVSNITTYMSGLVFSDAATLLTPRKVFLLKPSADGTHSFTNGTPDDFQNATPADYPAGNASTTIWNDVKEVPPDTTAFVQQKVSNTNSYVEFQFDDLPATGYGPAEFVQVVGAYHPVAAATANLSATRLNDGGTITAEATIDRSVASNTLEFARTGYSVRPNGGTAWTTSAANAAKVRYGYSTDIAPPPALDAIFLEVVAPIWMHLIGLDTEADTAQAMGRRKQLAAGLNTETDTAQAATRRHSRTVGLNTETDTPQAMGRQKRLAIGMATETDSAGSVSRVVSVSVGIVSETDTAQAAGRQKRLTIGIASETDTANLDTREHVKGIGLVSETDTAQPVTRQHSRTVGVASEADTSQPITHTKQKAVGLSAETDTAQATTRQKRLAIGIATEADTAQPVGDEHVATIGQASETDTVLAAGKQKRKQLGSAGSAAVETDTALHATVQKRLAIGIALEDDTALPVSPRGKIFMPIGIVSETDEALPFTQGSSVVSVGPGGAPAAVPDRQRRYRYPQIVRIGMAVENDVAMNVTGELRIPLRRVVEEDEFATLLASGLI